MDGPINDEQMAEIKRVYALAQKVIESGVWYAGHFGPFPNLTFDDHAARCEIMGEENILPHDPVGGCGGPE